MITRLKIDGFKNLVNVDLRFGPFTCIAGLNAIGKSNLFDAIHFLSDLSDKTLLDAAKSVRSEGQKNADIRALFHRVGENTYRSNKMTFEIEMLVPSEGIDELGQQAEASITSVKYKLVLGLKKDEYNGDGLIEILEEELLPIAQRAFLKSIAFHANNEWKKSVIKGRRSVEFISTQIKEQGVTLIRLHQDKLKGKALDRRADQLPKTVLSSADATQNPTALIVRNEMRSWKLIQLEPSALRQSDEFHTISNAKLGSNGSHLAATLFRLGQDAKDKPNVYQLLANRLTELVDHIVEVSVEKDEKRELLTLMVKDKDGTLHPARSLSDGTLRFIGLGVLELDPHTNGVICMEEPENGIHPEKITSVLTLLQDIAVDSTCAVGNDNPLRQVIINTHSPLVVQQVSDDSLLMAELKEDIAQIYGKGKVKFKKVVFSPLSGTWRTKVDSDRPPVTKGKLLAYLNSPRGVMEEKVYGDEKEKETNSVKSKRVIDRPEFKQGKFNF
jgi:predicted ATPase